MKQKNHLIHDSGFMIHDQSGQSLIETLVAIFVLTMALTSGLGLAIYAFSHSIQSQRSIIASGLAREGIEVVRMMRDTNWLEGDAKGGNSFDLDTDCGSNPPSGQNSSQEDIMDDKACYPGWLDGPSGTGYHNYDVSGSNNSADYRLIFAPATGSWTLDRRNGGQRFHLCLQADGTYIHNSTCDSNSNPIFARRVKVTENRTSPPFTPDNPEIKVESAVIWSDKKCPSIDDQDPITFDTPCKVVVQEFLTNWKDYK